MKHKLFLSILAGAAFANLSHAAAPVITTLPGGAIWQLAGTTSFDTGSQSTELGGENGQAAGPFVDSSFGVMDETGTPWFTGNDLSAQQYIQNQAFGNFGTSSPPGPAGARFFNFGYTSPNTTNATGQATVAGANFPTNAGEARSVTLNHFNNTNPDAGGVASLGQLVFVPTSATLTVTQGWGGDEMQIAVAGGTGGGTSQFRIDANFYSTAATTAFGGFTSGGAGSVNLINMNAIIDVNNAGGGNYGFDGATAEPWGYGAAAGGNTLNFSRDGADAVFEEGLFINDPTQGIPPNSVGHSMTTNWNVFASLVDTGGAFAVDFASEAELFISRQVGDADARASTGPGMQGTAQLIVEYEIWEAAIPEPSRALLAALGLAAVFLRRRR